jgi:hypothetical protein
MATKASPNGEAKTPRVIPEASGLRGALDRYFSRQSLASPLSPRFSHSSALVGGDQLGFVSMFT